MHIILEKNESSFDFDAGSLYENAAAMLTVFLKLEVVRLGRLLVGSDASRIFTNAEEKERYYRSRAN